MTKDEFNTQATLLTQTFGASRWPATRIAAVWNKVHDLEAKWFARIVEEMILKFDDRVNIAEQAAARRSSNARTVKQEPSTDNEGGYSTGQTYLEKLGYKSFSEFLADKNKMPAPPAKGKKC